LADATGLTQPIFHCGTEAIHTIVVAAARKQNKKKPPHGGFSNLQGFSGRSALEIDARQNYSPRGGSGSYTNTNQRHRSRSHGGRGRPNANSERK
jgi:hypothetical protein